MLTNWHENKALKRQKQKETLMKTKNREETLVTEAINKCINL